MWCVMLDSIVLGVTKGSHHMSHAGHGNEYCGRLGPSTVPGLILIQPTSENILRECSLEATLQKPGLHTHLQWVAFQGTCLAVSAQLYFCARLASGVNLKTTSWGQR